MIRCSCSSPLHCQKSNKIYFLYMDIDLQTTHTHTSTHIHSHTDTHAWNAQTHAHTLSVSFQTTPTTHTMSISEAPNLIYTQSSVQVLKDVRQFYIGAVEDPPTWWSISNLNFIQYVLQYYRFLGTVAAEMLYQINTLSPEKGLAYPNPHPFSTSFTPIVFINM